MKDNERIDVGDIVQVCFDQNNRGLFGKITYPDKGYNKIVFLSRDYKGIPMPLPEEEWKCRVVYDTKPLDFHRGALIVKPISKLEYEVGWSKPLIQVEDLALPGENTVICVRIGDRIDNHCSNLQVKQELEAFKASEKERFAEQGVAIEDMDLYSYVYLLEGREAEVLAKLYRRFGRAVNFYNGLEWEGVDLNVRFSGRMIDVIARLPENLVTIDKDMSFYRYGDGKEKDIIHTHIRYELLGVYSAIVLGESDYYSSGGDKMHDPCFRGHITPGRWKECYHYHFDKKFQVTLPDTDWELTLAYVVSDPPEKFKSFVAQARKILLESGKCTSLSEWEDVVPLNKMKFSEGFETVWVWDNSPNRYVYGIGSGPYRWIDEAWDEIISLLGWERCLKNRIQKSFTERYTVAEGAVDDKKFSLVRDKKSPKEQSYFYFHLGEDEVKKSCVLGVDRWKRLSEVLKAFGTRPQIDVNPRQWVRDNW